MARKRGNIGGIPLGILVLGIAGAVAFLVHSQYLKRTAEIARGTEAADFSTLKGDPCPTLSREAYLAQQRLVKTAFIFNDEKFSRRYGHVTCDVVQSGPAAQRGYFTACQFTGPAVLEVVTRKGTFYFAPGVGQPATVSTPDGIPRCMTAGHFGKL